MWFSRSELSSGERRWICLPTPTARCGSHFSHRTAHPWGWTRYTRTIARGATVCVPPHPILSLQLVEAGTVVSHSGRSDAAYSDRALACIYGMGGSVTRVRLHMHNAGVGPASPGFSPKIVERQTQAGLAAEVAQTIQAVGSLHHVLL